jgi:hypothetical protein
MDRADRLVWPVIPTERRSISEAASVALARRPVSPAKPPNQPAAPARQHGWGGGQEAPHLPAGLTGAAPPARFAPAFSPGQVHSAAWGSSLLRRLPLDDGEVVAE